MSKQNNDKTSATRAAMLDKLAILRQEVAQLEQQLNITPVQSTNAAMLPSCRHQLQEIVDNVPAVIYIKDIEGRYALINREFENISGLSRQGVIGKTTQELFTQELTDFFEANDREAITTNGFLEREWHLFNPVTQREDDYLTIVFPLHNEAGEIYATYGTITNLTTSRHAEDTIRASQQQMQDILDNAPAMFYVKDKEGRYLLINRLFASRLGLNASEIVGKTDYDLFTKQEADDNSAAEQKIFESGHSLESEWISGETTFATIVFPLRSQDQQIYAVGGISIDISAHKQAEAVQHQTLVQQEIIRAQELTLAELTTPLLSISDQAVVMPLIGAMDSRRVQDVIVTLLEGVARQRAQVVILDITGVAVVDTQVANAMIQAAQAVPLLGAEVIITGIRPEIAQTLVNLGVNLRNIKTLSSLHSGIAYAMRRS